MCFCSITLIMASIKRKRTSLGSTELSSCINWWEPTIKSKSIRSYCKRFTRYGVSFGIYPTLILTKKISSNSQLAGVILESPLLYKGTDLLETFMSVECPLIMLCSRTDSVVNFEDIKTIGLQNTHSKIIEFEADHCKIYSTSPEKLYDALKSNIEVRQLSS